MRTTRIAASFFIGLFTAQLQAELSGPGLTDFWEGRARFELEQAEVGAGRAFHFPSMLWEGEELWAYYIQNYWISTIPRSGVSRVRFLPTATEVFNRVTGTQISTGGRYDLAIWDGLVMDISGRPKWGWWATNLQHEVGRADSGSWYATTSQDQAGYLCHGPGTTEIPAGPNVAMFELRVDQRLSTTNVVVRLEVFDATLGALLNTREVLHRQFPTNGDWRLFYVNFTNTAGHALEFRSYWTDITNMRQRWVGVAQGTHPFFDDRLASFPGIYKDSGTYYLVYEGAGTVNSWPGDIGLATSADGVRFAKHGGDLNPVPILSHTPAGWERINIGTPSLYKFMTQWYLLYHGFDGSKVRTGIAYGNSLTNLTKWPQPILDVGPPGAWDSGTVGKRSAIIREKDWYYMAYEGSTDYPFESADWSSGMARSRDLFNWEKYTVPVVPVIYNGFGNDGPELVKIGVYYYLYVRNVNNNSDRYRLVWKP